MRGWAQYRQAAVVGVDLGSGQNDDVVVILDLHESGRAQPRRNLRDTQSRTRRASTGGPRRAACIVDEAVAVIEDELGARTLGDQVRRGRHWGLDVTC